MFLRVLPPASFPLTLGSVGRSLLAPTRAVAGFEQALAARLGATDCVAVSSGRAALYLALRVLARESSRVVVVVPAYTCYTIPAAVVRAGLRVRPCDLDPQTLDFDSAALPAAVRDDVLAVVAVGLYGRPADLSAVRSAAARVGARVIDDAAQTFGAAAEGRPCGSLGDLGISSFGRGKVLSTYEGGALVSTDAQRLRAARALLASESPRRAGSAAVAVKAAGYAIFQRPRWYGLLRRFPALGLGVSRFDLDFGVAPMHRFQAALGLESLTIVDRLIAAQRQRAKLYVERLAGRAGLVLPPARAGSSPVWLRFPVLAPAPDARDRLLARATSAGLGISASYPRALDELPELAGALASLPPACSGARHVSRTILTLPTHAAVRLEDQERILRLVLESESEAATGSGAVRVGTRG